VVLLVPNERLSGLAKPPIGLGLDGRVRDLPEALTMGSAG
jgi:hypothetical protein